MRIPRTVNKMNTNFREPMKKAKKKRKFELKRLNCITKRSSKKMITCKKDSRDQT